MGLIYIFFHLIIIGCLPFLIFFVIKKKKIGIIISFLIMFVPLSEIIKYKYSDIVLRNNIKNDLKILDLELNEEFRFERQISSSKSEILGASKMVEIIISEKDKLALIKQIKNSKNFIEIKTKQEIKDENHKTDSLNYCLNYRYNLNCKCPENYFNFKYPTYYSRKVLTETDNKQIKINLQINLFGSLKYDKYER